MNNPLKYLSKKEYGLLGTSLFIITISNILAGNIDLLTLVATWFGITALIFAAKGNVWGQILMIVFCILYGIISYRFRYWGEMITYVGMAMPMAIWSTMTWIRNPSAEQEGVVAIQRLEKHHFVYLIGLSVVVTGMFYYILKIFQTPNIEFSTLSVTTSFLAAALTMLRSSYYALGYAINDLVLIVLWSLAAMQNPVYVPVIVNFMIFFVNDMYAFISWKRREKIQMLI